MSKKTVKKVSLYLCVLLLIVFLFSGVLAACNNGKSRHPIDRFFEKMQNAENFEAVILMEEVPFLGSVTFYTKVDGNKSYQSPVFGAPANFTETIEDTIYTYTQMNGIWYKDEGMPVAEYENDDLENMEAVFDSENYDYIKDDNVYRLKENINIDFMDIDSLTLKFVGDTCEIRGIMNTEDAQIKITITIKNIGTTKVELPEV